MVSDQKLCTCIGELTIKLSYICLAAIGLEMCDTTMRILLPVLCNRYIESLWAAVLSKTQFNLGVNRYQAISRTKVDEW